jgi:hypothetical protein
MRDSDHDDLDTLFVRTAVPPPGDIGGRARARLRAVRGARRLTALALVDAFALLALALFAFLLGSAVVDSGLPALAQAGAQDRSLILDERREFLLAVIWGVPWLYVLAVTMDALLLYAVTASLLRTTDIVRAMPPRREARR